MFVFQARIKRHFNELSSNFLDDVLLMFFNSFSDAMFF